MNNLSKAIDTPWKFSNRMSRWIAYPYIRLIFIFHNISWNPDWCIYGIPIIQKHRQSSMDFGPGLQLRSNVRSNPLGSNHPVILCTWQAGAVLKIGSHFAMTGGSLVAAERITIGNHVNVGANTTILDTDFHPLAPESRHLNPQDAIAKPVVIEDDVFIGMNCLILKGVTIGKGSVIGAGSVVTKDIPPGVVAAGNPARIIREL